MALACGTEASEGLRNAILALCSFHLEGSVEALRYKQLAIKSLKDSLDHDSVDISETQLATSMMLCVYSVSSRFFCLCHNAGKPTNTEKVFDETDGNWSVHMHGAQGILRLLYHLASMRGRQLEYNFLFTWFLYHEVLGEFSQPLLYGDQGPSSFQLLNGSNFDKSLVCTVPWAK